MGMVSEGLDDLHEVITGPACDAPAPRTTLKWLNLWSLYSETLHQLVRDHVIWKPRAITSKGLADNFEHEAHVRSIGAPMLKVVNEMTDLRVPYLFLILVPQMFQGATLEDVHFCAIGLRSKESEGNEFAGIVVSGEPVSGLHAVFNLVQHRGLTMDTSPDTDGQNLPSRYASIRSSIS
ncbi:hypothetical protein V493_04800 [Pseudogymnoascus sp. VKM F-4281 (FW-2241)]|nr:hypothetical protein V493_04800 [Pseudogymnoascus sp. VKM F-4281 (FW-2241)]